MLISETVIKVNDNNSNWLKNILLLLVWKLLNYKIIRYELNKNRIYKLLVLSYNNKCISTYSYHNNYYKTGFAI